MKFVYEVRRGGEVLADGWTRHACVAPDGRPRAVPAPLRELIERGERAVVGT